MTKNQKISILDTTYYYMYQLLGRSPGFSPGGQTRAAAPLWCPLVLYLKIFGKM